ncbi:uncharacterized protein LOC131850253 [Achroia grisella]|uniref:uncharacterized protein LOC131850253 n=1 Tax=Achroia grisella TaxID=688607 RepID=UPI0027D2F5E5|nr:uncharacterized protein LOC131850253 [Achroia grisella]
MITTFLKINRVCSQTPVPRIFWNETWTTPSKVEKLSTSVLHKRKSTTSSEDECEKCKRIIEIIFAPNKPDVDAATVEANKLTQEIRQDRITQIIASAVRKDETVYENCSRNIFGESKSENDKNITEHGTGTPNNITLQSITAKHAEEKLAQKIEIINETPIGESAKPTTEELNTFPKVLGNKTEPITSTVSNNLNNNRNDVQNAIINLTSHDTLDELAKRCLDSPNNKIDDHILKEMEKLGIPQTTAHRESTIPIVDHEVMQIDILEKPYKTIQKSQVELEIRVLDPVHTTETVNTFGLDFNNDKRCSSEEKSTKFCSVQKHYAKEDCSHLENEGFEECNELEEVDTTTSVTNIKPLSQDNNSNLEGISTHIHNIIAANDEILGVPKLKSSTSSVERTITLLQSMNRHSQSVVYSTAPDDYSDLIKNLKAHENLKANREAIQKLERDGTNPSTPSGNDPLQIDPRYSYQEEEMYILKRIQTEKSDLPLKLERIKPHYLKDEPSIIAKEYSARTEPAVVIKECADTLPPEENAMEKKIINDLIDGDRTLPHHLLGDLSIFSKFAPESVPNIQDSSELENSSMKPERTQPYYLQDDPAIISKEFSPFTAPSILIKEDISRNVTEANSYNLNPECGNAQNEENRSENNQQIISNNNIHEKEVETTKESPERDYFNTTPILEDNGILNDPYSEKSIAFDTDDYEFDALISRKGRNRTIQPIIPNKEHLDDSILKAMPSSEMRQIAEDEYSEPVIYTETGRFSETVLNTNEHSEHSQSQEQLLYTTIQPEAIVNPRLDKEKKYSEVLEIASTETIDSNLKKGPEVASKTKLNLDTEQISMKELLKRVRERNRLECYREVAFKSGGTELEPLLGKCGQPKKPCPSPAPECPPKNPCPPPPCPPPPPPCPKPCKPACPDPCAPAKPSRPPIKKSPCEKFKKQKFNQIRDTLTVLLTPKPNISYYKTKMNLTSSKSLVTEDIITKFNYLGNHLRVVYQRGRNDSFANEFAKTSGESSGSLAYAKDYEPWVPIPSWPIPEKEKQKKFVCPKEGCKQLPPPPLTQPCKDNHCANLPKRTFSIIDIFFKRLGKKSIFDVRNL